MDPPSRTNTPLQAKAPEGTGRGARATNPAQQALREPSESPKAMLESIRASLGEGRYPLAQSLAREAAARFPEHPDVAKMNRALNEWKASTRPGSGVDRTEESEWMKQDVPESLRGKVVALVGKEVVAAADSVTELARRLRALDLPKRPLVFRVA